MKTALILLLAGAQLRADPADFYDAALLVGPLSDDAKAFALGFTLFASVRMFRAGLKWFKRAGTERFD